MSTGDCINLDGRPIGNGEYVHHHSERARSDPGHGAREACPQGVGSDRQLDSTKMERASDLVALTPKLHEQPRDRPSAPDSPCNRARWIRPSKFGKLLLLTRRAHPPSGQKTLG
jgi:hypothetical protein